ncbi:MAG: putative radical SAM protein YgiQ [Flavobacteriaceae bacterium]|jgi:uncharacterized radical SAM protein YgiQ
MDHKHDITEWLPLTMAEVQKRGWEELDVVIISGDAYVDHPAFGTAVIGRILESEGLRVAIVAQPNWKDDLRDFKKFGTPKLFFGITSGCMDTMVNHYTANKRRRSTDAYTPGNEAGFRPDYAVNVYSQILKDLYPDTPILIGGIEASLRRVTHYDYWADELFPNILTSSKADILVYGMGEQPLREIVQLLLKGVPFHQLTMIRQTGYLKPQEEGVPKNKNWEDIELNSHEVCLKDKKLFASNFKHVEQESNKTIAKRITQKIGDQNLIINPPYQTMTEKEMDTSFDLPYTRLPHPKYRKRGPIPAYEMIKFSINMHRGCFGGCSFCTISAHQGKFIASRSEESILKEVDVVTEMEGFKGYISDLGGPSANMYKMKGKDMAICDKCVSPSCIHPVICSNLDTNHQPMTDLFRKVDKNPKVKKAFVGSGIRYDLLTETYNKNADKSIDIYLEQVLTRHVSGRLKVAPEHTAPETLKVMRKPSFEHFKEFTKKFNKIDKKHNLNQQLIPYFISSHPGTEEEDMANLACETKELGFDALEQVQDFTPTPMTVATVIYYSGYHPYTLKEYKTVKTKEEKNKQNKFFFWYKKENHAWIKNELKKKDRPDLIERLLVNKNKPASKPKWLQEQHTKKKPTEEAEQPNSKKKKMFKSDPERFKKKPNNFVRKKR